MSYERGPTTPSGKRSGPSAQPPRVNGHYNERKSAARRAEAASSVYPPTQNSPRTFSMGTEPSLSGKLHAHLRAGPGVEATGVRKLADVDPAGPKPTPVDPDPNRG